MSTTEICLDSFEERESDEAVPIEIDVLVPNEHGGHYVQRKRYRTPNEIYRDLHKHLNLMVCECGHEWPYEYKTFDQQCPGCGSGMDDPKERRSLIDEYDTCCARIGEEDTELAPRDWHINRIAVYCEVGGNEGYSVYVTVQLYHQNGRDIEQKTIDVYRIKSFAGMEHCHGLVKRIMKLMGVWPNYGQDKE